MSKQKRFAIIGSPVLHSKSPLIFNHYFQKSEINARYTRIAGRSPQKSIELAELLQFSGLNVTAPFKERVLPLLDQVDSVAQKINSVNTIILKNGKRYGYNTDYLGVIDSFKAQGIGLKGKSVAIIGAGGAGRAALYGVVKEGGIPLLFNRTYQKAVTVAKQFGATPYPIEQLPEMMREIDIVISTISTDQQLIPQEVIRAEQIIFDANYKHSSLIERAKEQHASVITGIEWLLHQALPAGALFLEKMPDLSVMKEALEDLPSNYPYRNNIALIGFMGAGKSHIGQLLKNRLNINLVDTDWMLKKRANMSLPEIFKCYGEKRFREVEQEMVLRALSGLNQLVSCGGGVVITPQNRNILKKQALSVWLCASMETTLKRIRSGSRPLLEHASLQDAQELFEKRIPLYSEIADLLVSTEQPIDTVVGIIYDEINQTLYT